MLKLNGVAIRREGLKFVLAGVPEELYERLRLLGWIRVVAELSLAGFGVVQAFSGGRFSTPYLTFILSLIVFIELGRPDIEYKHNTSYTTRRVSLGDESADSSENGNSIHFSFDPPLVVINSFYLDEDGERIPSDEVALHGSEDVEIPIPPGQLDALGETMEKIDIGLPYPVRNITLTRESEEEYEARTPE